MADRCSHVRVQHKFHTKKYRKKLFKPAAHAVDHDLRSKWEDLSKALHYEEMRVQDEADDLENIEAMDKLFLEADGYRAIIEQLDAKFTHFRHKFLRAINADYAAMRKLYNVQPKKH